jgi:hypothetical protein
VTACEHDPNNLEKICRAIIVPTTPHPPPFLPPCLGQSMFLSSPHFHGEGGGGDASASGIAVPTVPSFVPTTKPD